jgi:hypothetical protein
MQDKITISTSTGLSGELKHASLDTKNQILRSHRPVSFILPNGTVRANALTLRSAEHTLTLRGKVVVHMVKTEKEGKKAPEAEAKTAPEIPPLPEGTGAVPDDAGALPAGGQ